MQYRLLALDLDGTVVDTSLVIAPAIHDAIAAAQERGVIVTIATGRTFYATLPFVEALGVRDPVICYQGALLRHPHTGEIYDRVVMPGALAAEGVRTLLEQDLFLIAYIDERLHIQRHRPELEMYMTFHPEGAEVVETPDLAEYVATHPPAKLLFIADPPQIEQVLGRLAQQFAGRLSSLRSHEFFGELTPLGISKGSALAKLAAQLGIPREQVIAIGDHENDLPMIEWAGLGLAMGNAIPEVRAAADAIIPSVAEQGVAWAIQRYLL